MVRYLPAVIEIIGLIGIVIGAYLINPALSVMAGGAAVVAVGYAFEDAK